MYVYICIDVIMYRLGGLERDDQFRVVRVGDVGRVDAVVLVRLDRLREDSLCEEGL